MEMRARGRTQSAVPTRPFVFTPELDGVRGIAVLLVVTVHTTYLLAPSLSRSVLPGGFLGVDLFFVLSGFLITTLLLQELARTGRLHMFGFYRRRALRLLPALLVFVVAHVSYTYVTGLSLAEERSSVISILTYTFNWRRTLTGGEGLGHMWSLAVEEQFYIVWPLLVAVFFGVKQRTATVVTTLTIAILAIAVYRAIRWQQGEVWLWLAIGTETRSDSLLVGALLAHLWFRGATPRRHVGAAATVATVFLAYCFLVVHNDDAFQFVGGYTLVAIAVAVVILAVLDSAWPGRRVLQYRHLRSVGVVSYGLYLWHMPIFAAVQRYTPEWPVLMRIAVAYSITGVATAASWRFVERPFLRWKARLEPADDGRRREAAAASTVEPSPAPAVTTRHPRS